MRTYNYPAIIPLGTVLNSNQLSIPMQLLNSIGYSVQIVVTGTPTGTFSLLGSADQATEITPSKAPVNFSTITNSSYAILAAGNYLWNIPEPFYNWVKLAYTDTSGGTSTAILTVATFNYKGF